MCEMNLTKRALAPAKRKEKKIVYFLTSLHFDAKLIKLTDSLFLTHRALYTSNDREIIIIGKKSTRSGACSR